MKVHDVHQWLAELSYWSANIPFDVFKTAFDNSYCIGAIKDGRQVAFGRLVTDYATFAYLADVYVEEQHREKGIAKQMMQLLFDLDWVKGLRAISLATRDAHDLYKQFGFTPLKFPDRYMQIRRLDIYNNQQTPDHEHPIP